VLEFLLIFLIVAAGTGGPIRVLLVGDSEASFLGFGLGPDAAAANVDFQGDGVFGCGLLTSTTLFHGTLVNGNVGQRGGHAFVPCGTQLKRWQADVQAFHPDVVLLAEGEYEVRNQQNGATWVHIGTSEVDRREINAITDATRVLGSQGASVVLLTAPYYKQLEQNGGQAWPEDARGRVDRYNALLHQVAAASNGKVVVADVNSRLDPNGRFAPTIDGQVVRFADGIHVTVAGAKLISPWLLATAAGLGTAVRAARVASPSPTTVSG